MKLIAILLSPLSLAACAASSAADHAAPAAPMQAPHPMELSSAPLNYAKLGETVYVDGPRVTPLELLEDSRCPAEVLCAWAGQVRIKARIHLGSGDEIREMTMGKPIQVADGLLLLMQVLPEKSRRTEANREAEHQFGFRFAGGL